MFDGLPSVELLESTHHFPCQYTFKAIGIDEEHFVGRVLEAVKSTLVESAEPSFSCRSTSSGKHICVTVEPDVAHAEHVVEIYMRLQQVKGLVMLL